MELMTTHIKDMESKRKRISHMMRPSFLNRRTHICILPESPVPQLLKNNNPANEEECRLIKRFLATLAQERCYLEAERKKDPESASLQKLETAFDSARRIHENILSGARCLPPEILEQIFLNCLKPPPRKSTWIWSDYPWALSQVCHRWRRVAINSPSLWNHLPTIDCKKISHYKANAFAAFLDELLKRSRDNPLTIHFSAPRKKYKGHPIIDVLVSHSDRWSSLYLETTSNTMMCFHNAKGRLQNLKALTLHMQSASDKLHIDLFQDAPQLTAACIIKYPIDLISLPWSQMIHIQEVTRNSTSIALPQDIDPSSLNLQLLEITRYKDGPPMFLNATLPHLTKLKLKFGNDTLPYGFLENLTLPAIEEIMVIRYPGQFLPRLTAIIARSLTPCVLHTLSVRCKTMVPGELTELLRLTPELENLEISVPPHDDLENLVTHHDRRALVPRLKQLYLQDVTAIDAIKGVIGDIASSRCECGLTGDAASDKAVYLSGEWRRLELFKLRFGRFWTSTRKCYRAHSMLNDFNLIQTENSTLFVTLAEMLCRLVPRIPNPYRYYKWPMKINPMQAYHLDQLFTLIESLEVRDIRDIYPSRLHIYLAWVKFSFLYKIPGDSRYGFRSRAGFILDRWRPLLTKDLPNLRWMPIREKKPYQLQYVPINLAPKLSSHAPHNLGIYGFKYETKPFGSVFDSTPVNLWNTEQMDIIQAGY